MLFSILVFPKLRAWFKLHRHIVSSNHKLKQESPHKFIAKTILIWNFDVVLKIKLWSYLECCVLLLFWVNNEKFCILALNAYHNLRCNSNSGALMHCITEVLWLTDCKLKINDHQCLVTEIFTAGKGYVMYEIVSWALLITAALCFTTQGCALPAPSWPMVLNHCSGATRKFFSA